MERNDAFVNVLATANNATEFRQRVEAAFQDLGFSVVELEDVELLSHRRRAFQVPAPIEKLARDARRTRKVQFDAFYTWTREDDI